MKYHLTPITILNLLQREADGIAHKPGSPMDREAIYVSAFKKGFKVTWKNDHHRFSGKKFDLGSYLINLQIDVHGYELVFDNLFIQTHHTDDRIGSAISATGGFVRTNGFRTSIKYYFQLIIPLQRELPTHYAIDRNVFDTDLGYRSANGTLAIFAGDQFQVCMVDHKEKHYLVIDSDHKQSYKSFSEKVHAIKNAIGYLTGHLAADAGCFFAYTRKNKEMPAHFYYTEWRNSIISGYKPVYSNPFGYMRNKKMAEKMYKKGLLRPFTLNEFGLLCQRLYDSTAFTGVIILILESSIASLLFMPGGFAIAMETLADLVSTPEKEKLAPIKTPTLSKKVRQGCTDVINTICAGLPEDDIKILLSRIDNLNQVTNKARLKRPFEQLGIKLSTADLFVLETRNDFLHGRTPDVTRAGEKRSEKRVGLDMYYAAMRFYTLLNRLILKWVGYDNFVLNHVKIQENATMIKLKEPYYFKD